MFSELRNAEKLAIQVKCVVIFRSSSNMSTIASTSGQSFRDVRSVLSASGLIDVVLSRTQRKTPTEIHNQFKISRIRGFYMRKVKFAQQEFEERLKQVVADFPKLDDIHPFFSDLCNVLYDRDHYKLALGQVKFVLTVIQRVARDYVKLMKFSDSLYKCKMLKRAALGRMATSIKRLSASLEYLESVRQHMSRLPQIDPNARTMILTGYPNVGKSSFMNKVTSANVEVQPYAFTTKSVYVGHMDYKYLRWQVLDTPGILDRPLSDRNKIEMIAITALAHINAAIVFFVDVSETCGYSITDQVALFQSIKVLFRNRPVIVVLSKVDVRDPETLPESDKQLIASMVGTEGTSIPFVRCSSVTSEGVDGVVSAACESLLSSRVEAKVAAHRVDPIENRITITSVARPREAFIPESVRRVTETPEGVVETTKTAELSSGGPGAYSVNLRDEWLTANPGWKEDAIPEIMDGMNIGDFIDPEIERKLKELEEEENAFMWGNAIGEESAEDLQTAATYKELKHAVQFAQSARRHAGPTRLEGLNRVRKSGGIGKLKRDDGEAADKPKTAMSSSRKRSARGEDDDTMDVDTGSTALRGVRPVDFVKSEVLRRRVMDKKAKRGQIHESDRFIGNSMPKHLFSGKRKSGTHDYR